MDDHVKKVFQKRLYDLLSHKYGILTIIIGAFLLSISAFHFGEAWLEWSKEKYEVVFHSFSDNLAGKSFRERLSLPVPIDVVYTWVNGTDPTTMRQLEEVRVLVEQQTNLTREEKCSFTNCLPIGVVVHPAFPDSVTLKDLQSGETRVIFSNVTSMSQVRQQSDMPANLTLLFQEQNVNALVHHFENGGWLFQGTNYTLQKAYYTSDSIPSHGMSMPLLVMITGFPSQDYTKDKLESAVAKQFYIDEKTTNLDLTVNWEKGVALFRAADKPQFEVAIKDHNFTLEGKVLRLTPVSLVWDLWATSPDTEIADYRFQDKEELRYSLRSLERFAPWVRHIFIVTNGQIPYWLNMDNPRLTVVTHKEIFANASHLPTFSSPAIEANLHRIPGLSDKFLYLNDDVLFGAPVWPDDFYSHSTGHKVYLSWPVPNCNDGCPSTWISDGYCDKACNSSECDWDGGDCVGGAGKQVQFGAGFHGGQGGDYSSADSVYCFGGCANSWLSDKYCDQSCNNQQCGFDAGDCGVDNYDKLHGLEMSLEVSHYVLPPGVANAYLNMTNVLGNTGVVTAAKFLSHTIVRTAAVSNKFKVLTILLLKGFNKTELNFDLQYKKDNVTLQFNFTVSANTWATPKVSPVVDEAKGKNSSSTNKTVVVVKSEEEIQDEMDALAFVALEKSPRQAKAITVQPPIPDAALGGMQFEMDVMKYFNTMNLSLDLQGQLRALEQARDQGDLTDVGLKRKLRNIFSIFKDELATVVPKLEAVKRLAVTSEGNISKNDSTVKIDLKHQDKPAAVHQKAGVSDMGKIDLKHQDKPAAVHQKAGVSDMGKIDLKHQDEPAAIHQKADMVVDESKVPVHSKNDPDAHEEGKRQDKENDSLFQNDLQEEKGVRKPRKKEITKSLLKGPISLKYPGDSGGTLGQKDDEQEDDEIGKVREPGRKLLGFLPSLLWKNKFQEALERRAQRNRELRARKMDDEEYLDLVSIENAGDAIHPLPWEPRLEGYRALRISQEDKARKEQSNAYFIEGWQGRQLLDAFGDSLRHVNRLYNKAFGFLSRKALAHMPHMIDKNIMAELQERFNKEWEATSSHQIRHPKDMQFAFAYYYYVIGATEPTTPAQVFDHIDTDGSGVLSDRELRTLATKLYDLPLYLELLTGLESMLMNCSQQEADTTPLGTQELEVYYDKNMPQVTKQLFCNCTTLLELVKKHFPPKPKYIHTIMDDNDVAFKIIHSNVSRVVGQLDDIRKNAKKFICLNDNMDHKATEAKTVTAVLQDFYESVLPITSQFELPRDYRNRFLHMDELREWRKYRDWLQFWTHVALAFLILFTILSFLGDKIENMSRKITRRLRRRSSCSSSSSSSSLSSQPSSTSSSLSGQPEQKEEAPGFWKGMETV